MSKPHVLAISLCLMSIAASATGKTIRVSQEGCDELDMAEIQRLMMIELADLAEDLTIRLVCEGQSVRIVADDQATARRLNRSIEMINTNLKERVIALSASQLVTASRLDGTESKKPIDDRDSNPPGKKAEDSTVDHLELSLGGGFKMHSNLTLPTGEGILRGDIWFKPHIGLLTLVSFEGGTASRDIGTATPLCGLAGLGMAWRFVRASYFRLEASLFGLAGYAYIEAEPRKGATGSSTSGITGEFDAGLTPAVHFERVFIALDLRGGYTIENPIGRVDDEDPVTLGGFWAGADIRFGWNHL